MKDIQNQEDHRRINIKKVGVKTISYPVTVLDKARSKQHTIATVNMYVNLPHHFKGTHMSRFVEILNRFHGAIDISKFHYILEEMKEKLEAEAAHIEMSFAYFLPTKEGLETLKSSRYECCMHGSLEENNELEFQVVVPVSLPLAEKTGQGLPRSLGHWGRAVVAVKFRNFLWIEDLIILIKQAIDVEQHNVPTQRENSLSVESLIRRIAKSLKEEDTIKWFSVKVENLAEGYSTFATMDSGS
ncbi:MAG: GTP cyclohydrolase I FolE2 [Proteobacteria bacterium]|nr:GTP cyclohydrolase I FolE2 [Pseudomonadota bacterium]MBU1139363.1 GTP cyclohydrolase I FolE2 [Pseudomonadota bacterium]MBU1231809.1 GTP cyclohydrolase I FolE2 [Pseudomonadota bacterium]MBU1419996.1 GTP cyclohydrolase I FolE2 [Pseudomonadota bacterium]MBU1454779.1 GTP cyclohydrolase I FolE2 [Pseudomonadota bacterium]